MAFLDDTKLLSKMLRKTFVTCDDTGICEEVIMKEGADGLFTDGSSTESLNSPYKSPPSPDVTAQSEKKLGMRLRLRDADAAKLIKRTEKPSSRSTIEEITKKDAIVSDNKIQNGGLGAMIKEYDKLVESSVWGKYAKFSAPENCGIKNFTIHTTMTKNTPPFCVSLATLTDVTVSDLIGLVCWRYFLLDYLPPLKGTQPADLLLLMADSEGKVDWDLPPLDHQQSIHKISFKHLAIVSKLHDVISPP